ncbi:MAG: dTDP-4-dehydrorhamnose reductase [Cyanobacteria bacterium J06642_3]
MTKILLIGSTGQVGQELLTTLAPLGEIIAPTKQELDLTQPQAIAQSITSWQPDIIVNAAAYTAVDRAEQESNLAMTINAEAVKTIALSAQQISALLIHISTDYVFAGDACTPYPETAPTQPLGAYGKSKLLGEQAIAKNCDQYLIVRTAWVYGSRGQGNFVKTMLRLGAEREELKVVADQIGSPTWSYDLAEAIAKLIQLKTSDPTSQEISSGTYHFTNSGIASWYDFAQAIFTEAKQLGFPLKIKRLIPIPSRDYPTPAQRPHYSVLAKEKYSTIVTHPPYWRNSLRTMLAEFLAEQQKLSAPKQTAQLSSLTNS